MATLIPSLSSCAQKMTFGERRFAARLEQKLEADYLLWYNVIVSNRQLRPDFVILHPSRGLFVLEVKDWKLDTIQAVNRETVTLLISNGIKEVEHPLEQARGYALALNRVLERDPELVHPEGKHRGKLIMPYAYGVVFSNITRKQFDAQEGFQEVFQASLVICQDEFYETVDAGAFQERLWNLSHYDFGCTLTPAQIDRVRWHLFPDIRIGNQLSLFPDEVVQTQADVFPDIIKVLDSQQEQLARSLGEGHRVIHGVAGSGKTLILAYRVQKLVEEVTKPILVLCYNVSLASRLRWMTDEKGLSSRVVVSHFHEWCLAQLREYRIPRPNWRELNATEYNEQVVQQVISAVDRGMIPANQYGAVMVDEGHDFQPEWLKLVVQMIDQKTKSLLILYDDAQNLYGAKKQKTFSFKSVGIQAQGRTTILRINYRNTKEILTIAYEFAKEMLVSSEAQEEDIPMLVKPESAGLHGVMPQLIRLPSLYSEAEYLVEQAKQLHDQGQHWHEMGIIYRSKFIAEEVYQQFQQADIPIEWINRDRDSRKYNPGEDSIKLVTMHSSKGLEFPVVFIPGVGFLPNRQGEIADEIRLLYVAMTRAVEQLVMTCDRSSEFVSRIEQAIATVMPKGANCAVIDEDRIPELVEKGRATLERPKLKSKTISK
jgi:UvrD-like helicase C-terminal domain/Nuclease-related domain/AAA domain